MLQLHAVTLELAAEILRPNLFTLARSLRLTQMRMQSVVVTQNADCERSCCFVSGVQTALAAGGRGRSCNINLGMAAAAI